MFSESVMYINIVDKYTVSGHVVGMLDRDQRTAKLRCNSYSTQTSAMFTIIHPPQTKINHYHLQRSERNISEKIIQHKHKSYSHSTRARNYLWKTLRRLKQALITGIYLLSLISVPCSFSAPTSIHHMADRREHPKWINPCGMDLDNGAVHDMNAQNPRVSDSDLLTQIVSQARVALSTADQIKEDFAQNTFNTDSKRLHEDWKEKEYDWLPQRKDIHKGLNETIPDGHLSSLKIDETLLNTYHYLQMIAVGLEQVVWDQQDENGPFLQGFNQSQYNLRLVLCEIQMAMYERGILHQMKPDVSRDRMPEYLRIRDEHNSTARNLRDWIIYRDYINTLQYVIQVFDYLKTKL